KSYDLRSWWFMAVNTISQPFDNQKVREAMHLTLDRNELRELTIGVDPNDKNPPCEFISGPFVQSSPYYNRAVPLQETHNRDRAKALLAEAGATETSGRWLMNGNPITIRLGMNSSLDAEAKDLLNQLGNQFGTVGLDRQVHMISPDEWNRKIVTGEASSEFDLALGKWSFGVVEDVTSIFHTRQGGKGALNIFNYTDAQVDKLLMRFEDARTDTEARDAYHDLHATVAQKFPYIFLWKLDTKSAWRMEIKGNTIAPYFYFTSVDGWSN
ncbi:MAG: ABC-type transport system substrate-binding protein, partial [Kiritimatiellia bacterium]